MSTSLPEDVQIEMMKTIPGLENVSVMRSAYAIEYDCIEPTQLKLSLELRNVEGLFLLVRLTVLQATKRLPLRELLQV